MRIACLAPEQFPAYIDDEVVRARPTSEIPQHRTRPDLTPRTRDEVEDAAAAE